MKIFSVFTMHFLLFPMKRERCTEEIISLVYSRARISGLLLHRLLSFTYIYPSYFSCFSLQASGEVRRRSACERWRQRRRGFASKNRYISMSDSMLLVQVHILKINIGYIRINCYVILC